jgi:hypothetical protein
MYGVHPDVLWFVYDLDKQMQGGGKVPSSKRAEYVTPLLQSFKTIGWKESVLKDKFAGLSDQMFMKHNYDAYRDNEIIEGFVSMWYNTYGFDTTIEKTLRKIGLGASIAKHLDRLYSPLLNNCYTDEQLIALTIQHQMGRFKPLTSPTTTHYYRPDILDTWIPFQTTQCFNVPYRCSKSLYVQYSNAFKTLQTNVRQKQLFFHTTNWKSCLSILKSIQRLRSPRCSDFGMLPGFYITPSFLDALDWGQKRGDGFSNEVAIVVFSVPVRFSSKFKYTKLEGEDWSHIVAESRRCKDPDALLSVDEVDFVYGPMLANPMNVKQGVAPQAHVPPKYQLVSKSDAADKFLQTCIVGCLFFQKDVNPPS